MNRIDKIEAIVNAVASLHDYSSPESDAYKLRNPLLLKSFSKPGKHNVNEKGIRQFESFQGGYRSAVWDLELKLKGSSNTGLQPSDRLKNLLAVLGLSQEQEQMSVVFFLRKSKDKDIDLNTPLSYFNKD